MATQTFTKIPLSGSTDGNPIAIISTATPGSTIHTATSSATLESVDEVWLWASSTSTANVNIGIQIGNLTDERDTINILIPPAFNGPFCVLPGAVVRNSRVVQATASVAGRVNVFGYVNRINGQG